MKFICTHNGQILRGNCIKELFFSLFFGEKKEREGHAFETKVKAGGPKTGRYHPELPNKNRMGAKKKKVSWPGTIVLS